VTARHREFYTIEQDAHLTLGVFSRYLAHIVELVYLVAVHKDGLWPN
jgi:hypothetical protein